MGFEKIDKAEEVQRQVNQEFSNEPSVSDNCTTQTPLTNAENENLTQGLSGEAQGTGFSGTESEALTGGLSGNDGFMGDSAELHTGITLPNQEFEPSSEINLPQNYIERLLTQTDENKVLHIKTLIQQLNLLQQDSPEYRRVLSELEKEKFSIMNDAELRNYVSTKIWNSYNNHDLQSWEITLNDFYEYKFAEIDNNLGISGTKEFISKHTNLTKLIAYINEKTNENNSNISKIELIWATTAAISEVIEKIISAKGGNLTENITKDEIIAALKSNQNPLITEALGSYFGIDLNTPEDEKEQPPHTPGKNKILTSEEMEAYKKEFSNLTVKEFRSKISEAGFMHQLTIINELIEKSEFSKSEKQMLYNECLKRQGDIQQNSSPEQYTEDDSAKKMSGREQNMEDQRVLSALSYNLFSVCKSPAQREMARIILEDERLYLASKDARQVFAEIIARCENKSDIKTRQNFIEKVLQVPELLNENGALNNYIILCIRDIDSDNLEKALNLLNEYGNSSDLSGEDFAMLLYSVINGEGEANGDLTETIIKNPNKAVRQNPDNSTGILQTGEDASTDDDNRRILAEKITENIALINQEQKHEALTDFCSKVLSDNELGKDVVSLKILSEIVSYANDIAPDTETIFFESAYNALKTGYKKHSKEEEISASVEEIKNIDYSKFISEFVQNKNKSVSNTSLAELAVVSVLERKTQLFENFTTGRSYTNELLYDLLKASQKTYCIDILADLSKRKEFSAKDIVRVANLTSKNTVEITQKVLSKSDLTSEEKVDVLEAIQANREQMGLIKLVLGKDELNLKALPKILKAIKILDEHNAVNNHERINLKKLNEYTALLENPKTENWVVRMLNLGFDIETISQMNPNESDTYYEKSNGTIKKITDENIKFFLEFGMNEYEAITTVNAISRNGSINTEMRQTAVNMIQSGVPKDLIGEILNCANTTGTYNPHITADAMSVRNMGLNAFAERYLPIINNLSAEEIAVQFSSYIIEQLKGMLIQLPKEILPALRAKGFNIDGMNIKLNIDYLKKEKTSDTERIFRDISEIDGLEKTVIEKYKLGENVWFNKHLSESWAAEKYLELKNRYSASAENSDKNKAERLNVWFEYIETNEQIKSNPFAQILLAEFVTNYSQEDGSRIPPVFDEKLAEKIIASAISDEKTKEKTQFETTKSEIQQLLQSQDYKAVLEKMGIKVEVMSDGSWEISHFTHFINGINISEYGINENSLLAKVSRVKGGSDLNSHKPVSDKQNHEKPELSQNNEKDDILKKKKNENYPL